MKYHWAIRIDRVAFIVLSQSSDCLESSAISFSFLSYGAVTLVDVETSV